jgi:hypothetical protein
MGWKNVAKLAAEWADAKKTELLTADQRTERQAGARADLAERQAHDELGTSMLEAVLPAYLSEQVTANRPENVAARQDAERRERLAGRGTARVELRIAGEEHGTVEVDLPIDRTVDEPYADDPLSMPWLRVTLEAPDPVPLGTTSLSTISIAFPGFTGPGTYDLPQLYALGESGAIESWEPLDLYIAPDLEAGDTCWYWDATDVGAVAVSEAGLSFDLAMVSAVSSVRVTGIVTWG